MPNTHTMSITLMNMDLIDDEAIKALGVAIYKNQNTLKTLKLHF